MKNTNFTLYFLILALGCTTLVACDRKTPSAIKGAAAAPILPPIGVPSDAGVVPVARVIIRYSSEGTTKVNSEKQIEKALDIMGTTKIDNVVTASDASISISTSQFQPPAITNSILDFGKIILTSLTANNIDQCKVRYGFRCKLALLKIYTIDAGAEGFYSLKDGYGVPMTISGPQGKGNAGLGADNAYIVQTSVIPYGRNYVLLSDFQPGPSLGLSADFTDAGAGKYQATIVIEFSLAQGAPDGSPEGIPGTVGSPLFGAFLSFFGSDSSQKISVGQNFILNGVDLGTPLLNRRATSKNFVLESLF